MNEIYQAHLIERNAIRKPIERQILRETPPGSQDYPRGAWHAMQESKMMMSFEDQGNITVRTRTRIEDVPDKSGASAAL